MTKRWAVWLLAVAVAAAACGDAGAAGSDGAADGNGASIVVTTTILGDLVSALVGTDASVEVLMPLGADPHGYALSAAQASAMRAADLLVVNGLRLEEGMLDAIAAAEADGVDVVTVADAVDTIPLRESGNDDDHEEDEEGELAGHDGADPHIWLDPLRMAAAMTAVAEAVADVDDRLPDASWERRAASLADDLAGLDAEIREILQPIPQGERVLVTNHESLGYFADAYGFEVAATVIPGGATLAEPSAADLEHVVDIVVDRGVPAIFAETTDPSRLAEVVAAEVGTDVAVAVLYTGSLSGPGGPAATYADLMRHTATTIADALG